MDLTFYFSGLHLVLNAGVILSIAAGTLYGIIFGAMPGLTATAGIALIIPITYGMDSVIAISFLLGTYLGGVYGGCIPAILINIPGAPGAIMTMLDGYPMSQQGKSGLAIGLATVCSFLGGLFSVFLLAVLSLPLAKLALSFSAQEYTMVAFMGLSVLAYVSPKSTIKGLIVGIIGLLISTIGQDPLTAYPRFAFDIPSLYGGVSFIPAMIGLYGLSSVFEESEKFKEEITLISQTVSKLPGLKLLYKLKNVILRSSIIGVIIGAIPGTGASIAAIIAYGVSKSTSKNSDEFGKGSVEGIAAPESANNAATGGALIPTMALGIPGCSATAVMLGAFILHGFQPGPLLFVDHPEFCSSMFLSLFISNIFLLVFGLLGAQYIARVVLTPKYILVPLICIFCIVGAYGVNYNFFDVAAMIFFGLFGYVLKKLDFSIAPMVLGIILGPIFETNLRRSLILSRGDWSTFFTRPISLGILCLTIIIMVLPRLFYFKKFDKKYGMNY